MLLPHEWEVFGAFAHAKSGFGVFKQADVEGKGGQQQLLSLVQ